MFIADSHCDTLYALMHGSSIDSSITDEAEKYEAEMKRREEMEKNGVKPNIISPTITAAQE